MRLAVMALSLAASSLAFVATASPLDRLHWEHRALLVFSPAADDERAHRLDARLAARDCELRDRDLVVLRLPAGEPGRLDAESLTGAETTHLRETFRADDQAFAVVLVGKDGGEKLRSRDVPDLDEIFALIDGMPMRRTEMAARGPRCTG